MSDWRSTWSRRYLDRVAIQRPEPEPVYRPLTDEEIALLPESVRAMAYLGRGMNKAAEELGRRMAEVLAGIVPPRLVLLGDRADKLDPNGDPR